MRALIQSYPIVSVVIAAGIGVAIGAWEGFWYGRIKETANQIARLKQFRGNIR